MTHYPADYVKDMSFRLYLHLSDDHPNNPLHHIRGFVDGVMIVAIWHPRKRYWMYDSMSPWKLEYATEKVLTKTLNPERFER